jgi:hypothetical protein
MLGREDSFSLVCQGNNAIPKHGKGDIAFGCRGVGGVAGVSNACLFFCYVGDGKWRWGCGEQGRNMMYCMRRLEDGLGTIDLQWRDERTVGHVSSGKVSQEPSVECRQADCGRPSSAATRLVDRART